MTGKADSPARIAADLELYLRQQLDRGVDWVLDEQKLPFTESEPAASEPAAAAASATAPASATAAAARPVSAPASAAASAAASSPVPTPVTAAAPAAQTDDFAMECVRFVENSVEQIRNYQSPPPESDLFSTGEAVAEVLDREQKRLRLDAIAERVAACRECKLCETRNKTVAGAGDPDADLVFVGEAPGRDEDRQGIPFVGPAGQLLDGILKAIDLGRDEIYVCNILKCRPPNNRDPEADEVTACEPFLREQLEIIRPRLICCLGRHAATTLLDTRASLGSLRDSLHFYEGIPLMATYHPAALLRNAQWKRPTWNDVRKLRALYDALRTDAG